MQSVLTVICSTLFASRRYPGAHTIPRSLRYAAKRLYELCPKSFFTRRNRRNSPSMARFLLASASMPRHFCALQHNSTDTKQLRYSPALQYRLPPPPAYPQSIRTWARGCLHNFLKNILHATTASSQPLCGKLKTSTASHSHHRPAKLRQRILLHSRYGHLVASKHICHLLLCLILHIAKLNQSALALIK